MLLRVCYTTRAGGNQIGGTFMSEYTSDVQKYASNVQDEAISGIVKYLGIALKSKDASLGFRQ